MRVLLTGANGYIGTKISKKLISSEHDVVAIYRNENPHINDKASNFHAVKCDLNQTKRLTTLLDGCDLVMHLAADLKTKFIYKNTLSITKSLLKAMDTAGVDKIILCSSISVLDYASEEAQSQIDNTTPLCINDDSLGEYARMKRDQEKLVKAWAKGTKRALVMRPGLVYSDAQISSAHIGYSNHGMALISSHHGQVPVVKLSKVANDFLRACDYQINDNLEIHQILDDYLPSQTMYAELLRRQGNYKLGIKLHWRLYTQLASIIRRLMCLVGLRDKIPDFLRKNSVLGRATPLSFKQSDIFNGPV